MRAISSVSTLTKCQAGYALAKAGAQMKLEGGWETVSMVLMAITIPEAQPTQVGTLSRALLLIWSSMPLGQHMQPTVAANAKHQTYVHIRQPTGLLI